MTQCMYQVATLFAVDYVDVIVAHSTKICPNTAHTFLKSLPQKVLELLNKLFIFLYFQLDTLFFRLRTISAILFPLQLP